MGRSAVLRRVRPRRSLGHWAALAAQAAGGLCGACCTGLALLVVAAACVLMVRYAVPDPAVRDLLLLCAGAALVALLRGSVGHGRAALATLGALPGAAWDVRGPKSATRLASRSLSTRSGAVSPDDGADDLV